MNKHRNLFLTLFATFLVQLTFMTPASASLNYRETLSNQSTHTPSAKQNFSRAENRDTAAATHAITAHELGMKHLQGNGAQKDIERAIHLFKYAALSGNVDAQLLLGLMYQSGIDIPTDYKQAQTWFKQAAAQGNSDAQLFLGLIYSSGKGVKKDYAQALSWFHKAAQQNNPAAEFSLGIMYTKSLGVPQDIDQALFWFRKAAQDGDARAQHNLEAIEKRIRNLPREKIPQTTMNDGTQGKLQPEHTPF